MKLVSDGGFGDSVTPKTHFYLAIDQQFVREPNKPPSESLGYVQHGTNDLTRISRQRGWWTRHAPSR